MPCAPAGTAPSTRITHSDTPFDRLIVGGGDAPRWQIRGPVPLSPGMHTSAPTKAAPGQPQGPAPHASICPLGEDNLEQILDYRFRMMDECGMAPLLNDNWRELTHTHYAELFFKSLCLHHGAFVEGRLVGTAGALIRTAWPANTLKVPCSGWIMDVYVEPEYRGRGLARRLTRAAVDWLRRAAVQDIRLTASAQAKSIGLYEPLGFQYTNEMRLTKP